MDNKPKAEAQVVRVAELAMKLGGRHLADYGATTSRKDFTQRQLMTCLILRAYLKTTYRGLLDILEVSPRLREAMGLSDKLPHYTTLQKFSATIARTGQQGCIYSFLPAKSCEMFCRKLILFLLVAMGTFGSVARGGSPPALLIGYTEYRTNLRGGRHANCATMRACVVQADGTGRRVLAEGLTQDPDTWTQFAGWSPDGRMALLARGWGSPTNAAWEEEHKSFRMTEGGRFDTYFLEMNTGALTNITGVERVSDYNSGVFFWPGKTDQLGFQALIKGISHPFTMDIDGRNKQDISSSDEGFTYGFHASPDGKLVSYHKDYRVYIADADGAHPKLIDTGHPFNFMPTWSGDGQWVLFVS